MVVSARHAKCRLVAALAGLLVCGTLAQAAPASLSVHSAADFKKAFEVVGGDWTAGDRGAVGVSPRYHDLPGTKLDGHVDDAHTYFVVHAVNLWRYAVAGAENWDNYTLQTTVKILDPAPRTGARPGQDCVFMNYQWGREAIGSDAAIVVRYAGPDRNYMVRFSSAYGHVELWKTKGGVLQVKPCKFEPNKDYRVAVTACGRWILVAVDGRELIRYCDVVEPIEKGKVGLAVRESKVQFSDITVVPAAAITDAASVHQPAFTLREWLGRPYLFDGDEPIGHFARPEAPLIEEVKLVPGVMPFCTLPGSLSWGIDWKPNGQFKVTRQGATMAWTWTLEEKNGFSACVSDWTLTYDLKIGYVWDHKVKLTALVDGKQRWGFDLVDPCFYQTVAPATGKMPACRTSPNYGLWLRNDGRFGSFPTNHQFKNGGAGGADLLIKPGGFWATTVDDWAAVYELPADNPFQFAGDYCHWGLDQHISPSTLGVQGPTVKTPARKGETFTAHLRVYAFSPARVKEILAQSVLPDSADKTAWARPMLVHDEPVNHFRESVNAVAGDSKVRWLGRYAIDASVGRGDSSSMRIDGAQTGRNGENSPWLQIGPSYRTGPYVGLKYRIGMWVKTDRFQGTVAVKAKDFVWPVPRKLSELKAELTIRGKCDWTHVSFESDFPRVAHAWNMSIEVRGEGVVWVDDVEITPLDAKSESIGENR